MLKRVGVMFIYGTPYLTESQYMHEHRLMSTHIMETVAKVPSNSRHVIPTELATFDYQTHYDTISQMMKADRANPGVL